jgi:hypothetical protein
MAFNRDAEPHNLTTAECDQRIRERRLAGESLSALAREYDISPSASGRLSASWAAG